MHIHLYKYKILIRFRRVNKFLLIYIYNYIHVHAKISYLSSLCYDIFFQERTMDAKKKGSNVKLVL